MSFDATVYFAAIPDDFAAGWQAALRALGMDETVLIPPDWEKEGWWYLLDDPMANPEDCLMIAVGVVEQNRFEQDYAADEEAMLSAARYFANVSTRLSAGTTALMIAGSLAKTTAGVLVEPQVAAFEKVFEADVAAFRGARGPAGKPTLAERGFYDFRLAWEIAKAASAYELRQQAQPNAPPQSKSGEHFAPSPVADQIRRAPAPQSPKAITPIGVIIGLLFILWALSKLHKAGYF